MNLVERKGVLGALKTPHPALSRQPEFRARFAREMSLARRIDSPHVAAVLDGDAEAKEPWFVCEFIDGPSLHDHVSGQGPLSPGHAAELLTALMSGLSAIHAADVVHRDIKPGNVMLSPRGPVIVDFGIATGAELTSITTTGGWVGSAAWMAPEQLDDSGVSSKADVWAAAVVVAYAASGNAPFGTGASALRRIAEVVADLTGVSEKLRTVLQLCLARDPDERPTAAEALNLLRESPVTTPSPSHAGNLTLANTVITAPHSSSPGGKSQRSPLVVGAVAVAVIAATTAAAAMWIESHSDDAVALVAPTSTETPVPPTPSREASTDTAAAIDEVGAGDLPLWEETIEADEAGSNQGLYDFLSDHVGQPVWMDVQWRSNGQAETFDPTPAGLTTVVRDVFECLSLCGTEILISRSSSQPDAWSFDTEAGTANLLGAFVVDHAEIGTGGILVASLTSTAPDGSLPSNETSIATLQAALDSITLAQGLSSFDPDGDDIFPDAEVTEDRVLQGRICGTRVRPRDQVPHRSAIGGSADDYEIRELFAFPNVEAAIAFVDSLTNAASQCPMDGFGRRLRIYESHESLTGYVETAFTETYINTYPYESALWSVMRVGTGVLVQSKSWRSDAPPNRAPAFVRDVMGTAAVSLASQMCVFTAAGC